MVLGCCCSRAGSRRVLFERRTRNSSRHCEAANGRRFRDNGIRNRQRARNHHRFRELTCSGIVRRSARRGFLGSARRGHRRLRLCGRRSNQLLVIPRRKQRRCSTFHSDLRRRQSNRHPRHRLRGESSAPAGRSGNRNNRSRKDHDFRLCFRSRNNRSSRRDAPGGLRTAVHDSSRDIRGVPLSASSPSP